MKKNMQKKQKNLWSLLVIFLLISSVAMYAVAAKGSDDGSSGSSSSSKDTSSSDSSSSKSSDAASKNDVKKADDKKNAEAKANNGNSGLKIEVKDDKNKAKAEIKDGKAKLEVKANIKDSGNNPAEIKVKAESKNGFSDIISRLMSFIFGKKTDDAGKDSLEASAKASGNAQALPAESKASDAQANEAAAQPANRASAAAQAAGVIITGGVSGPGYPTGPLNLVVPSAQLFLDKPGQAKQGVGQLEVKGRQYEVPLETIPPTLASIPVTINGVANTANEIKVISNIKVKNGVGQHSGTIDVDIDVLPAAGHLTLQYSGTATVAGSTTTSGGVFKTAKSTGIFAGLVAEGTYMMTITESGSTPGAPATVTITTTSQ